MANDERSIELYLVRHAHAGDPATWEGPDELRPLSEKGRRQAERLGTFLASVGFKPELIVASPKLRASQTAEIVAKALGMDVRLDDRLAGELTLAHLASLVEELGVPRPMLVGHDPDFTTLVGLICDASGVEMKKGALARIDTPLPPAPGSGMLRWLVPPDLLKQG